MFGNKLFIVSSELYSLNHRCSFYFLIQLKFRIILKVMVCGDRIGWRENSRKIIIVSTDRDYHFAMDGKLAGIFRPNDGECHLNNTGSGSGFYTEAEVLDYPSVSHINSVAQLNNFIIIFAVTEQYQEAYSALSERITGSKVSAAKNIKAKNSYDK